MWRCLGLTSHLIKNVEPMNCWRTRPTPEVRRTHYPWVMLVAVACSSLGCGGEVVGVGSVTVKITPDVALAVGVGQTIDFSVTVNTMSSDISGDGRVYWSVDNVQVASIDENGVATAISPGVTHVMVTVDGQNDMAVLEVYVPGLWGESPLLATAVGWLGNGLADELAEQAAREAAQVKKYYEEKVMGKKEEKETLVQISTR